jgi:hypothetical protein
MKAWVLSLAVVCPMAGLLTMAQTQDSASAAPSSKGPAAAKTPSAGEEKKPADQKPRKVWTNDEIGTLQGTVSVVGTRPAAEHQPASSETASGTAADPRRERILRYRAQIAELQNKIDAADQRINQMKNFKAEDSSPNGGINPNGRYIMVPLDEQVKQLEARKKQLLANIEELENQAKKDGIEPGELR